ncbi:Putative nuclease [Frankliniella fusca]|uniref:Nuclease n=1 Tax=Frankliniella fusca TaxID=407009 RepID=A0AAE1GZ25_9NEOP|nr:Putative nuclease [Frankliniella fusca]
MCPFARNDEPQDEDSPEARFNNDLCSDRSIVERAIGLWKNRWRAVLGERVLRYAPLKVCQISIATAILHNICILEQVPGYAVPNMQWQNDHVNNEVDEDNVLDLGRQVKERLMNAMEQNRQ